MVISNLETDHKSSEKFHPPVAPFSFLLGELFNGWVSKKKLPLEGQSRCKVVTLQPYTVTARECGSVPRQ